MTSINSISAGITEVVLVNEQDVALGTMEKMEAHEKGILHRAFSIFIFNAQGDMLLQKRAAEKYHSGNLWTNACCSHPLPGEAIEQAALRRLQEEMGFSTNLEPLFTFIYKAHLDRDLTEHELDHVLVGTYSGPVYPHENEVSDYRYIPMQELRLHMNLYPEQYTAWFKIAFPRVEAYLAKASV